jgi:hypothetical protein
MGQHRTEKKAAFARVTIDERQYVKNGRPAGQAGVTPIQTWLAPPLDCRSEEAETAGDMANITLFLHDHGLG